MDDGERRELAEALASVIRRAGKAVLEARAQGFETRYKDDASPVTSADLESEAIVTSALSDICPEIPVVGEESFSREPTGAALPARFFLLDPLDGTREFVAGREDFTINAALIEDGVPTLGVLFAPALRRLFLSWAEGAAFEYREDGSRQPLPDPDVEERSKPLGLVSRSHQDDSTMALVRSLRPCTLRALGSSLKFALVAAGEADFYVRLSPTMAWDSAAGQALIEAAGGAVLQPDSSRLAYSLSANLRNEGFLAARTPTLARRAAELIRIKDAP